MGSAIPKKQSKSISPRTVWIFTLCVFVLGFALRFFLADFTKSIAVYMDELRYYDIARSLWRGEGIAIRNLPETGYSKVLYSLLISPAFAFSSVAAQTRAIAAINSLLVNSAVFPALLLARRVVQAPHWQMALVALTALLPDMAYSMTYMSEISALPLTLWVVWTGWRALCAAPQDALPLGLGAGALSALLYMNKEVALAYPMAFAMAAAFQWGTQKETRRALLGACGGFAAGFALVLGVALLLLPGSLGSSYDQTGLGYYDSAEKWAYLLYALVFNAATALIAFLYLPVVLGLFRFKAMGGQRQSLYVFCLSALAVLVFVIAYSITVREDFGERMPRQHIRYYAPLLVPLLALCLGQLGEGVRFDYKNKRLADILIGGTALLAAGCVLFFLLPTSPGFVDHALYKYLALFSVSAKRFWAVKLALCAAILAGTWALFRLNTRLVSVLFAGGMALVFLLGNIASVKYFREFYAVSKPDADNVVVIDEYLRGQSGAVLVLAHDELAHRDNLILDTYITTENARYSSTGTYRRHLAENGASLAETPYPLYRYVGGDSGIALERVAYILLPAGWQLGEGAEKVEGLEGIFVLYRLEDPAALPGIAEIEELPE